MCFSYERCGLASISYQNRPSSTDGPQPLPVTGPEYRPEDILRTAGSRVPVLAVGRLQNRASSTDGPQPLPVAGPEYRHEVLLRTAGARVPVLAVGRLQNLSLIHI